MKIRSFIILSIVVFISACQTHLSGSDAQEVHKRIEQKDNQLSWIMHSIISNQGVDCVEDIDFEKMDDNEKVTLLNFISDLSWEKYAVAHSYLAQSKAPAADTDSLYFVNDLMDNILPAYFDFLISAHRANVPNKELLEAHIKRTFTFFLTNYPLKPSLPFAEEKQFEGLSVSDANLLKMAVSGNKVLDDFFVKAVKEKYELTTDEHDREVLKRCLNLMGVEPFSSEDFPNKQFWKCLLN